MLVLSTGWLRGAARAIQGWQRRSVMCRGRPFCPGDASRRSIPTNQSLRSDGAMAFP